MYEDLSLPQRLRNLMNDIRELVFLLRNHRKARWNRVDPFGELFFDRMEKAPRLGHPDSVTLYDSVFLCGDVRLGERVFVGQGCLLDGSGGLTVGQGTTIAAGAKILTHDTISKTLSAGVLPIKRSPVVIEDHCFIGVNAVVTMGIRIGSHSVVGAGAVVTSDVPAYTIVAGTPAKPIGHVNKKTWQCHYSSSGETQ